MSPVSSASVGLFGAVSAVGAGYSAYLTAIGAAASRSLRTNSATAQTTPTTRFRILIPAHNEEMLIKDTVAAALAIQYPASLFEVHVVADNCSDRTAAIAEDAGANVHRRDLPDAPGKGPALMWLLDRLPQGEPGAAIVILDADTLADPNMLAAFASNFANGVTAVQGHYAVRGEGGAGEVDLRSAAFAVRHLVRPAGRVRLGGSSSLYGNGMAFDEGIARRFPWSAHLTEDLEMGLRLLLAGERVEFAPGAVVRGEMPDSLDGAESQHERWEAGRRAVARRYTPRLLHASRVRAHGKRWAYVDAAIDISMPPFGTLTALTAGGAAGMVVSGKGATRTVGAAVGLASLTLQLAHILLSLRLAGAPRSVYLSLLRAPRNIVWKLGVLARTRTNEPTEWVRTSRNSNQVPTHDIRRRELS